MNHSFATSPSARGEQRKFINPTPGFVGANLFGPDGKPTSTAVEPGGEVWLTPEEERMTAEAPRLAKDNPFIREWEEVVEWDDNGQPLRSVLREGILVLADEPPRPIASDRFIPERAPEVPDTHMTAGASREPKEAPDEETVTGAPDVPKQPPVEGQPSPDEVVGTPEATAANDEALSKRESTKEQRTSKSKEAGAIPV